MFIESLLYIYRMHITLDYPSKLDTLCPDYFILGMLYQLYAIYKRKHIVLELFFSISEKNRE